MSAIVLASFCSTTFWYKKPVELAPHMARAHGNQGVIIPELIAMCYGRINCRAPGAIPATHFN